MGIPLRGPNQAIPIDYTFGLFQAAKQTHGSIVAQHLSAGGRLGSWWAVVGISLLFLAIVLAVLFGVILLLPDERTTSLAATCQTRGAGPWLGRYRAGGRDVRPP